MGKGTIGAKIQLDGEREFKDALSSINKEQAVLRSETTLLQSEFKDTDNAEKKLTETGKILAKQVQTQAEKVSVLEKALANSTEKLGSNDKRTQEWQIQLNQAKSKLNDLNGKLEENKKALKGSETNTQSLGEKVGGLADKFGVSLPSGVQKGIDAMNSSQGAVVGLVGVLSGMAIALGKCTMDTAKVADDLLTMSTQTGLTTDALQEFNYASELIDVSTDTMTGSMAKMIKSMDSARNGSKDTAEAYKSLGVHITDHSGKLRDANTVFYEAVDALGNIKNETERDAISMRIFGKSAQDLNPLIEAGAEKLKSLAVEAHKTGYVMDNETLQSFGQLDDATQRMNNQMDALKNSLALALLPVLTVLFETISKIPTPVLAMIITLAGVITTILLVVKAIKGVTDGVGAIKTIANGLDAKAIRTTAIIMGVVIAVTLLAVAIATLTGKGKEIQHSFDSMGSTFNGMQGQVSSAQNNAYQRVPQYAKGTSYHTGGIALVGEQGPEYVDLPRGAKVYPNGVKPQSSGGDTYHISINAKDIKEFNDIVRMSQNQKQFGRAY